MERARPTIDPKKIEVPDGGTINVPSEQPKPETTVTFDKGVPIVNGNLNFPY